jgi:hypothetical protein
MEQAIETLERADENNTLSSVVITLLKGVIYQDSESRTWDGLLKLQARVRDYISILGLDLVLDESEGYAFVRAKPEVEEPSNNKALRLVARRPLTFPVSLLIALLRKKLAEFDATGGDTRLVLSKQEIVELLRVFLPDGSNETKMITQVDAYINKVIDLGFLRRLKTQSAKDDTFEVRRILKAFVDAQWLSNFNESLAQYQAHLLTNSGADENNE